MTTRSPERRTPPGSDDSHRDPALPTLPRLLDLEEAASILSRLHPVCAKPEVLAIEYVRYKPGRSVLVGYAARFEGASTRLYAKAYADGSAARDETKASTRPANGTDPLLPFVPHRELGLVLFAFPCDAALRDLGAIADPSRRKRVLARAFPGRALDGWRPKARGTTLEPVRYKPEDRFVFRLEVRWRSDRTGGQDQTSCYGRLLPRGVAKGIAERYFLLASTDRAATPAFLGIDPRTKIFFVEPIEGLPLLSCRDRLEASRLAGVALASFGGRDVALPAAETLHAKRQRLYRDFAALEAASPEIARRATRFLDALPIPPSSSVGLVHGDFHADQILLAGERAAFLDLDRAGPGDPEIDAASFRAHLKLRALRKDETIEEVSSLVAAFEEGRRSSRRAPAAAEALALLDFASSATRRLEGGWRDLFEAAFVDAERATPSLLSTNKVSERRRALPALENARLDRAAIRPDGSLEFEFASGERRERVWALVSDDGRVEWFRDPVSAGPRGIAQVLDPGSATRLLRAMEGSDGGGGVARTELLSLRPKRRAVVRWVLEAGRGSRIAKIVPPGKAARLFENARRSSTDPPTPRLPRLVGALLERGLLVFQELPGESLHARLSGPTVLQDLGAVVRSLRSFHGGSPPAATPRDAECEVERVRECLRILHRHAAPHRGEREEAFEALLSLERPELSRWASIHGDFHDRQVLLGTHGVAFLDLDAAAPGDPALDLGNLAAHFHLRESQGAIPPGEGPRLEAEAADAYGWGDAGFARRFDFYRAAALARLVALYSIRRNAESVVPALLRSLQEATRARR